MNDQNAGNGKQQWMRKKISGREQDLRNNEQKKSHRKKNIEFQMDIKSQKQRKI